MKQIRVVDLREGPVFEVDSTSLVTQIYETSKKLLEERDKLMTAVAESLETVDEAVLVMVSLELGNPLTSKVSIIRSQIEEIARLTRRIQELSLSADRFSGMMSTGNFLVKLTLEQAKDYGF